MLRRSSRRVVIRAIHRAAVVAFHICLLVSLWRAPVPWFHSHDSLGRATTTIHFWQEHLQHFHTRHGVANDLGWHLHFVWPWELADRHEDGQCPGGIPHSLRVETARVAGWVSVAVSCELDHQRVVAIQPAVVAPRDGPHSIRSSHSEGLPISLVCRGSVSWQSLACVARC
jgi:hypothetical protein